MSRGGVIRRTTVAAVGWSMAVVLLLRCEAYGTGLAPVLCLTATAGEALSGLVQSGGLAGELSAGGFRLQGVGIGGDRITVKLDGPSGESLQVLLTLGDAGLGSPDGRGDRFAFHIPAAKEPIDAATRSALLVLARKIEGAVPLSALGPCAPPAEARGGEPGRERRYGSAPILLAGGLQVLVVLWAIAAGWRSLRAEH